MNTMSVKRGRRLVTFLTAFLILGFSIGSSLLTTRVYAATGSMYITGTSSAAHGGTVTLNLRINPGTAVTVVQSSITYDATKLQYVGINASASPFDTNISQSQSSGSIQIDRATLNPSGVSTDSLIATITFTALPYSGSTTVNVVPPSNAAYNGSYTNPSLSGATVNFTPGSCPSGQTGTPPNCTTPPPASGGSGSTGGSSKTSSPSKTTPGSTTAPTPDTTAAPTSNLAVPTIDKADFQYTMATITAKTNVAAQVQLKYGLSADSLNFETPLTTAGTTHTITVSDNLPIASTIYYQLIATDGITTKTTTTQTTKTKGLNANILLLDKTRKPITGQVVTIGSDQAISSKDGYVTFNTLTPGEHQVVLKSGNKTYKESFTILANIVTEAGKQTTPQQNIFIVYRDYVPANLLSTLLPVAGGVGLLGVAGAGTVLWRRHRFGPWGRKLPNVPIEGLVVSGQPSVQPTPPKTPFTEQAYNPFESKDIPSGPKR